MKRASSSYSLFPHCLLFCLLAFAAFPARADLVLETETAELGKKGTLGLSVGVQVEREKDGTKTVFTLNQFEYALTDRAEILIEPFFHEWVNPADGKSFEGMGDLEITPSYMVVLEKGYLPAVVLAFKLKVPTAKNFDIGTGEYDYLPYIILGKTFGPWVLNANFGYNFITSPRGQSLNNQFIYDISAEYEITPSWSVYGEIFANTSPQSGARGTFSGAVATEYRFTKHFNAFISIGYDTDRLFNVRPGLNYDF